VKLQKGFTVVELILYAGLLVIFLGILSNLFLSSIDIKTTSEGDSSIGQDARLIIARLNYDLLRASSIVAPALGTSSGTLTLTINGVNNSYALSSNKLTLTDGVGTSNLNGSETSLTALNFQTLGNTNGKRTVKVTFTISGQTFVTSMGTR